jgi:hypothetical protein
MLKKSQNIILEVLIHVYYKMQNCNWKCLIFHATQKREKFESRYCSFCQRIFFFLKRRQKLCLVH